MSIVSLININVLNNPAPFNAPYKFEITFECLEQLKNELVSVTVILLSCSYNGKEFVRVGYYVNNEYDNEELRENPPSKVAVDHIVRNVLAEKPRVTRFNIVWDNEGPDEEFPPEQPEADEAADDEDQYGAEDDDDEEDYGEEENEEEEEEDEDVEMEDPDAKPTVAVEEGEEDIENSDDEDEDIEDAPPIASSMQGF